MKKIILFLVIIGMNLGSWAQSPVTLEKISKVHFTTGCWNGELYIKGYNSDVISTFADCDETEKEKEKTIYFDIKTFDYLKKYKGNSELTNFAMIEYTTTKTGNQLNLSSQMDAFNIAASKFNIPSEEGSYIQVEYGYKQSELSDVTIAYNYDPNNRHRFVFRGIAISKFNIKNELQWTNTFPRRGIYTFVYQNNNMHFGQPLVVFKDDMLYIIYNDQVGNFDTKTFAEQPDLISKFEAVAVKINLKDGTYEKFSLGTYSLIYQYLFFQSIDLGDGNHAILGQTKSKHTYTFYKLSIK